jgi:hypothetical protein
MRSAALLGRADRADRDGHLPGHSMTYRDAEAATGRQPGKAPASGHPTARPAGLVGAALGAWLGMLTALLVGVLLPGVTWLPMLPIGLAFGAAAGGALGLVTHWALGRPDSSSGSGPRRAPVRSETGEASRLRSGPRRRRRTVPGRIGRPGGRDGCVIASLDRVAFRPATRSWQEAPTGASDGHPGAMRSPQR